MSDIAVSGVTSLLREDILLGFIAVLITAVGVLYKKLTSLYNERNKEKDEISEKLFEMMSKRIESDVRYEEAFKHLRKTVEKLVERL